MDLRPHQELAVNLVRDSVRRGMKKPIVAAPCSFGKTVFAGHILKSCQDMGKRGWFFCDRINLVNQTIDKFRQFGIDFGVRQAGHELHNPSATVQIASVQTVQAMVNMHNGRLPEFDMCLVDEAHIQHKIIKELMDAYNNIPFIGLTATPFSRGLGKIYNNLVVPATTRDLLEQGYLCPITYYGGAHIDLKKIRSIDANTYSADDLERETDIDKERLTGDIIQNWLTYAQGVQTIAFSPSKAQSRYLTEMFNSAGVSAEHIDCDTPSDEREDLYKAHDRGEFMILSCSRLLNTGYDAPRVGCVIDCFPVKSLITWVQRVGRLMRIFPDKDKGIYLDHASNFARFGPAEDVIPEELHDGEKPHREQDLAQDKDKVEASQKECPQCHSLFAGRRCACGYERTVKEILEHDGTLLEELTSNGGKAANQKMDINEKAQFLAEMRLHCKEKGWGDKFAIQQYVEKFGVTPEHIPWVEAHKVTPVIHNWFKHRAMRKRYAR